MECLEISATMNVYIHISFMMPMSVEKDGGIRKSTAEIAKLYQSGITENV